MHDWVLLSSFHLFNDASQRCIKSLVGVATCRLAPLLCLFMEDAKTEREKKRKKGEARGDATVYKRKAASDVFTGHGRLTDSGLGWSHRHAFLQRCVKLRFSSIFFTRRLAEGEFFIGKRRTCGASGKKGNSAVQSCLWGRQSVDIARAIFRSTHANVSKKRGSLPPTSLGMIDGGRSERDSASGGWASSWAL